ncbi:MAG: orotidine-5'-phosphate decarboxylase [Gemmatimonadetes bacterium]|nr:orotidine-5'-phosphate decarboxylase [Gemmatimonadota bacterium]
MSTLIVALDLPSPDAALALVGRLGDDVDFYKIGSPLFTLAGPPIVHALRKRGKRVFLDLKYHDIPNTVAAAVRAATDLGVELLTVHAGGGIAMMQEAVAAAGDDGPRLVGVTVLTSFTASDVEQVWAKPVTSVHDEVVRLARLAAAAGLHGVVSSPLEVEYLKRHHGREFLVVTPGIRPAGHALGDQNRVATPSEAARAGADYLVVGRPVTAAPDPAAVVAGNRAELQTGLATA